MTSNKKFELLRNAVEDVADEFDSIIGNKNEDITALEEEVKHLKDKIEDLEDTIYELEKQVTEKEKEFDDLLNKLEN